jgi:SAM-dependent methyltransferase
MLDSRNIVYRGKLFDGAASNLGVPALGYDRVFQEVHRVLKPSGRFVFSEWPTDPNPSFAALRELLEKHGTRTPSKDLSQVREAVRLARTDPEAKALGDPRAVLKALGVAGFERRDATTKTFPVRFASVEELLGFAASYGWYERELREMPTESRRTFDEELEARLGPLTTPSGIEDTWTLNLFVARSE